MKLSINTKVLSKYKLTMGEFLVLLIGFYKADYEKCYDSLVEKRIIHPNLFKRTFLMLSERSQELVSKILAESDEKVISCGIDFENLAKKLQEIYPDGTKAGTTYLWRGKLEEIAQKLRSLVALYDFSFTEEEAINAVKEYMSSFNDTKYMSILKYFILKTYEDEEGNRDIESPFMTIIENNRQH